MGIKADIFMNPIRQRIAQYLLLYDKGTANEILTKLNDIPPATLYRHLKVLLENHCIEIVSERKVRGTIEKTYQLIQNPMGEHPNNSDIANIIQSSLFSLITSFQCYFEKENIDPMKDMISLTSSTLMLSDEEFMELFRRIGEVYNDYIQNTSNPDRKPRNITIISSPIMEE